MNLFFSDGSLKNYHLACDSFNEKAHLLDNLSYDNLDTSLSYHTSLKDLDFDKLMHAIEIADRLEFGIFEDFNDNVENRIVNTLMYKNKYKNYKNLLGEPIEIQENEIVFLGCSHTSGVGVTESQRYSYLTSQALGLTEKNLAVGGTGIWQMHDTFFRCKFNNNQKVVLQLSDPYRINYFSGEHVKSDSFKDMEDRKLLLTYSDDILAYQEYSLINSIISSSKSQNIDLLCFRMSLSLPAEYNQSDYLLTTASESVIIGEWVDLGTDNMHPGPLTHEKISSTIVKKLKGTT